MVRLLVIRHGETEWNASNRIQGQLDTALNARGRSQARAAAAALAHEPIDELWSSDLARAHDTARALAELHPREILLDARLRERHFGILQGLTYQDAERQHPERLAGYLRSRPDEAFITGESLSDFYARVAAFFCERAQAGSRTIATYTHGGVVSCLYRYAKSIPLDRQRDWPMPNAAINEFVFHDGAWTVTRFGDVRHLEAALDDVG